MTGQAHSQRLVAGAGRYVDDLVLADTAHLAVLRSTLASARLIRVDVEAARALPGVVAVVTGQDLAGAVVPSIRSHPGLKAVSPPPLLPNDRVRYVGQPVAAVVAETRALARDALEQIEVEYEPLPIVGSVEAAIAPDAPLVHEEAPGNLGGFWHYTTGEVEPVFAQAEVTVALRVSLSRGHGNPLETRGCLGRYDSATGELTVWVGHQLPHALQEALAGVCGLPRHRVRVVTPDIGGAFGLKNPHYPEYFLAALLAMRTGRPVKWIEERREHLLATTADRDMIHDLELAATRDGLVLGVRDRLWVDLGCYAAIALTGMQYCAMHVPGPYRIRHIDIQAHGVFTHRSSTGSYRGFGRTNGTFAIERGMDRLAEKVGVEPTEVRRRNLIRPDEMPWSVGITPPGLPPMTYDSGDYPRLLSLATERLDYVGERERQAQARQEGRYVGIGLACFVEASVGGGEGVLLRLEPSGRAVLVCGAPDIGQGARATWAGLAGRELGLRPDEVDVVAGDTGAIAYGMGTFGSRTAAVAANATALAAKALAQKIRGAASRIMECAAEDVELVDGLARLRGVPDRQVPLREVASRVVRGAVPLPAPGLEVGEYFTAKGQTWASGAHAVVLEIEPETAHVEVRRYVAVGDSGNVLEPAIVEGQTIGGVAQGVGGSLLERMVYDDQAQLLSSTLLDYALPTAQQLPMVEAVEAGSPSPLNPLGTKGAGEGGCMGAYAAIASALEDALRPLGIHVDELPMTHDQLFRVLVTTFRDLN